MEICPIPLLLLLGTTNKVTADRTLQTRPYSPPRLHIDLQFKCSIAPLASEEWPKVHNPIAGMYNHAGVPLVGWTPPRTGLGVGVRIPARGDR